MTKRRQESERILNRIVNRHYDVLRRLANEEEKDSMSEHFDAKYTLDDLLEKSQGENPTANAWETDKIKPRVGFKRLSDDATIPTKAHATDSGFDLYASEDVIIEPGETAVVKTGIAVELPPGYEAQVRPRSGVTAKTKLRVQIGTIDQDYRGEIGVIVDNTLDYPGITIDYALTVDGGAERIQEEYEVTGNSYLIRKGDRIAQLVIQPLPAVEAYEIEGELDDTERGAGGFGSTGINEKDGD